MNGPMTAQERKQRARIAANERWARPGARAEQSATLRAATRRRLQTQVDPDGVMSEAELEAAIQNANKAIGARLNAAKARKQRSQA